LNGKEFVVTVVGKKEVLVKERRLNKRIFGGFLGKKKHLGIQ
jgi:hypothetical protein